MIVPQAVFHSLSLISSGLEMISKRISIKKTQVTSAPVHSESRITVANRMYGRSLAHERFKIREFEGKYKKQIKNYVIMVVIHLKRL